MCTVGVGGWIAVGSNFPLPPPLPKPPPPFSPIKGLRHELSDAHTPQNSSATYGHYNPISLPHPQCPPRKRGEPISISGGKTSFAIKMIPPCCSEGGIYAIIQIRPRRPPRRPFVASLSLSFSWPSHFGNEFARMNGKETAYCSQRAPSPVRSGSIREGKTLRQ